MSNPEPINTDTDLGKLIDNLPKGQDKPIEEKLQSDVDVSYMDKKYSISWLEQRWFGIKPIAKSLISIAAIFIPQVKAVDILWKIVEPEQQQSIQGVNIMPDTPAVGKKWYVSKVLWVNVVSIAGLLIFGNELPLETVGVVLGVINTILRFVTKEEIIW